MIELPDHLKEVPPRLERSPHPYNRHQKLQNSTNPSSTSTPLLRSTVATPVTEKELEWWDDKSQNHTQNTQTPSESGSEADDEKGTLTRALPAPPVRPRKGLRGITDDDAIDESAVEHLTFPEYVTKHDKNTRKISSRLYRVFLGDPDDIQSGKKFRRSRKAELLRRTSEVLLMSFVAAPLLCQDAAGKNSCSWPHALSCHVVSIPILCLLYVVRLLLVPLTSKRVLRIGSVLIPSTFDPAPLLYPTFVPPLVAGSVAGRGDVFIANCVLGLAALPDRLFPRIAGPASLNLLHWILTLVPAGVSTSPGDEDTISYLYPLLATLLPSLQYLTTTSLLRSELKLLAIALINIGLFAKAPYMTILSIVIWIGGLGLFVCCLYVLKWNVALERVPRWRLKRAVDVVRASNSFWSTLAAGMNPLSVAHAKESQDSSSQFPNGGRGVAPRSRTNGRASFSEVEDREPLIQADKRNRSRTITLPAAAPGKIKTSLKSSRSRTYRRISQWCYSMTPKQAETKKWLYAGYTYAIIISLVIGPIRQLVSSRALGGQEPFGWAIGYLFGDLEAVQKTVQSYEMEGWIPLPSGQDSSAAGAGWMEAYRHGSVGAGNTRLLLFGYWVAVIAGGIGIVLQLSTSVEVDTRRKVFHGMMVVMLLPTAYVDPAFLALGLTLVLAVFLLLDLIRAAQLRPLSRPLALFLTPYVDGRDLRGPVVISHIFLLIGCAIPLWLSLAGMERAGSGPWTGWELASRDISMVAGVVCVGMGDAAASLIGRRFGRHKWPWSGGKSLEGSMAFAAAVTIGLLLAKAWLVAGGWQQTWDDGNSSVGLVGKAWLAGCGASLTEAVLTGCNDNVVVPVILWMLVRGLRV
ncbi:hypothetical protein FH972_021186 [Carpinus fangiana]|uniref:dolichol kinase n=1 Tax=Carpinus fangiana TaxID=176857 RepID=A0A5N6KNM1_9ROSI|nr:hypothetical protein FH972_021186 [Carpinus fangiana]